MLPLQFLRVKITNKGKNITPLFCGSEDERSKGLQLAGQMIEEFQEVSRKKKRKEILNLVFSKIGVSPNDIEHGIWSDLEENKILESFDTISAGELLDWYNLSLMQTLLFNCTKLEFQILGGLNWKHVLRKVKMLGLMYNLQHLQIPIKHQISDGGNLIIGRGP